MDEELDLISFGILLVIITCMAGMGFVILLRLASWL